MNGTSRPGAGRVAAMLLVFAALFHVQWLAACEYMPMAGAGGSCCATDTMDHGQPCERKVQGHECVTPFAKGTSGIKLPERLDSAWPDDRDIPLAALCPIPSPGAVATGRPPQVGPGIEPDERSLYLSSSRLRL